MDLLKAEIKRKATTTEASNGSAPPAKRVQRPGDIEPAASSSRPADGEALLESAKKVARAEEAAGTTLSKDAFSGANEGQDGGVEKDGDGEEAAGPAEAFKVSNEEAVRRLRALGQPVRLFGESDKERRLRLRALQLIEERSQEGRNELMRTMQGMEGKLELEELEKRARGAAPTTPATLAEGTAKEGKGKGNGEAEKGAGKKDDEEAMVDLSLVKTDPKKVYPQIYFGLKRVLKEWEKSMAERPDHVRRSTQGKVAAANQQQSAENLKPLFKSLRKRELEPDVLSSIAEIVHHMQTREYIQANDAYLRLSIGNAPWPIGVTMVGIHERSGREKIFSNNVAHVLNDEVSRKYIQSLKRILTFAQTKWPPSDLSQKMG